jgi:hypothetical protein
MMNTNAPIVGQWYISRSEKTRFSVVDIDADSGYIELQDPDGFVADIGADVWRHIDAERIVLADISVSR